MKLLHAFFAVLHVYSLHTVAHTQSAPALQATNKDFHLILDGSSKKLKIGEHGVYKLKIQALNGFKVSHDTPLSVKLSFSNGLSAETAELNRKNTTDPKSYEPAWSVAFEAQQKGTHVIDASVNFFLCTEKICQKMTTQHKHQVIVE